MTVSSGGRTHGLVSDLLIIQVRVLEEATCTSVDAASTPKQRLRTRAGLHPGHTTIKFDPACEREMSLPHSLVLLCLQPTPLLLSAWRRWERPRPGGGQLCILWPQGSLMYFADILPWC